MNKLHLKMPMALSSCGTDSYASEAEMVLLTMFLKLLGFYKQTVQRCEGPKKLEEIGSDPMSRSGCFTAKIAS